MKTVNPPRPLPENFEKIVEIIVKVIAKKYLFGIYDIDDIIQEIYIFCLEAIYHPKFDSKRNLYNYLFTHVRHRLKNLKRNKYFRSECPCKLCSFKETGETDHPDKQFCAKYLNWLKNNMVKKNLAASSHYINNKIDIIDNKVNHEEQVDLQDFLEKIDSEVPIDIRETYLKMKSGITVSYRAKEEVLKFLERYRDGY